MWCKYCFIFGQWFYYDDFYTVRENAMYDDYKTNLRFIISQHFIYFVIIWCVFGYGGPSCTLFFVSLLSVISRQRNFQEMVSWKTVWYLFLLDINRNFQLLGGKIYWRYQPRFLDSLIFYLVLEGRTCIQKNVRFLYLFFFTMFCNVLGILLSNLL